MSEQDRECDCEYEWVQGQQLVTYECPNCKQENQND